MPKKKKPTRPTKQPSVKIYFNDQTEYMAVNKLAAQHDMTVKQYARSCLLKVSNDILAERAEYEAKAQAAAQATETTDENPVQEVEEVGEATPAETQD